MTPPHRRGAGSPAVVALGGGHGLAASLAAARRYAGELTAIVSVADDGGSSGRLRDSVGIPPPGDLRKCLAALADPSSPWATVFQHRFEAGELEGHALGNLIIAGLAEATGDFQAALDEAGRLVEACGRVLPATTIPVVLKATTAGGEVEGQVAVGSTPRITRISLVPSDAHAPAAALEALQRADQVVVGPGSLYTSVLAVLAVPAIRDLLASCSGQKVYVCNLAPEQAETAGYDVASHVVALSAHGFQPDVVLCDTSRITLGDLTCAWTDRRLADPSAATHDPTRLAAALGDLLL